MASFSVGSEFDNEEFSAICEILNSGETLNRGLRVSNFESDFAKYVGAKYAVAVSSCTAALRISYQALGLSATPGNVIVQVNSFWNTVVSLLEFGQKLNIVDVSEKDLGIDIDDLKRSINSQTRAIVITDFGGHPSKYDKIIEIAKEYEIPLIADDAHAVGAIYKGRHLGGIADISCFSFSSLKNMSTLGEGGMLVTSNEEIYLLAKKLRECWPIHIGDIKTNTNLVSTRNLFKNEESLFLAEKYMRPGDALHPVSFFGSNTIFGTNFKMTAVQAAVGSIQLRKLDGFNKFRREISEKYRGVLRGKPITVVEPLEETESSWHLFNVLLDEPNLEKQLCILSKVSEICGSELVNRYWPINEHTTVKYLIDDLKKYPNYYNKYFGRLISLPVFPAITDNHIKEISNLF